MRTSHVERRRRARYLRLIATRLAHSGRTSRGSLSRAGSVRHAFRSFAEPSVNSGIVLIDANAGKQNSLRETLGINSGHLSPLEAPLSVVDRFKLVMSALLPRKTREVQVSMVIAEATVRALPSGATGFLWNPYSLLQYAISVSGRPVDAFLLAPNYPAPIYCRKIYCNSAIRQIHQIADSQWVDSTQRLACSTNRPVVRIYPTRLDRITSRLPEVRMLRFAHWLDEVLGISVEIYLHYGDEGFQVERLRKLGLNDSVGHLVKEGRSMENLSTNQISFSASSTIGFELVSRGHSHIFVSGPSSEPHVPGFEVERWFARINNVVEADDDWTEWVATMVAINPSVCRSLGL